jgi:hypothetical protein
MSGNVSPSKRLDKEFRVFTLSLLSTLEILFD